MVIFPLAPDQTIAQMWSNGARGGVHIIIPNLVLYKMQKILTLLHVLTKCCRCIEVDANVHSKLFVTWWCGLEIEAWSTTHFTVLWHCWLGHRTCKTIVSKVTYNVSNAALLIWPCDFVCMMMLSMWSWHGWCSAVWFVVEIMVKMMMMMMHQSCYVTIKAECTIRRSLIICCY